MTRRQKFLLFLVAWVILIGIAYSPTILYISHSLGFGIARAELAGVRVQMHPWWVPVQSPASKLGLLSGAKGAEFLFLVRAGGIWPGVNDSMTISRLESPPSEAVLEKAKRLRLSWGELYVVNDPSGDQKLKHLYSKKGNLLITVKDLDTARAIKDVQ